MSIKQLGVAGAGTMGNGIAQVCIDNGMKLDAGYLGRKSGRGFYNY